MSINLKDQSRIISVLGIVSIVSVFLGITFKDSLLIYVGVAVILLDTVLLIDYNRKKHFTDKPSKEEAKQ